MRVLLVNAPTYRTHLKSIPLGLLYMISYGRSQGREIELLDGSLYATPAAFDRALASREFDVVGISSMTHNFPEALRIAKSALMLAPSATVVLGGVHPSTVPHEAAEAFPEGLVLAGEGEHSFVELLRRLEDGSELSGVPGLARLAEGVVESTPAQSIADLDALPFPAYDAIDFSRYSTGAHGLYFKRKPFSIMITSRGCPFHCSFCAKTPLTGSTWRARSAESVLDEIEMLAGKFGIREIHFEDDNIALEEGRLVRMCEGLLERKLDITWKCPHGIYASHLSAETFRLMARSGCYSLSFGIESGNDEILKKANKASSTATLRAAVELAGRAGIQCVGFFILGLEGETAATIRQTIDFAKSLPLDSAQFNLCVPFIGTPIREIYLERGYIAGHGLGDYDVDHAIVNLPGLSARDLKRWRLRAFLEFYLRPRVFVGNVRNLSSPDMVRALYYRLRNIWRA